MAEIEASANGDAETVVSLTPAGTWKLNLEGDGIGVAEYPLTVS